MSEGLGLGESHGREYSCVGPRACADEQLELQNTRVGDSTISRLHESTARGYLYQSPEAAFASLPKNDVVVWSCPEKVTSNITKYSAATSTTRAMPRWWRTGSKLLVYTYNSADCVCMWAHARHRRGIITWSITVFR